jgi:hypothetical protein
MHTLLAQAALRGWDTTPPRALTVPDGQPLIFVGFTHAQRTLYTYWNPDSTLHDAQLYRGWDLDPYTTTSDPGVALGWITAHGAEVAA